MSMRSRASLNLLNKDLVTGLSPSLKKLWLGLDGRAADVVVVKSEQRLSSRSSAGSSVLVQQQIQDSSTGGHHGSATENSNVVTGTGSLATLDCRQGSSTESWSWRNSVVAVKTHTQERR
ncbi:hypothetical protein NL676_016691 [Syzygium grande]|nr:hypothetical protein NL676_016691 [Syzygium grande]